MTYQRALKIIKDNMSFGGRVINEATDMIEIAVEKQIPQKPLIQKFDFSYFGLVCPECEKSIVNAWNMAKYKPNYCHYCGQALDWGE